MIDELSQRSCRSPRISRAGMTSWSLVLLASLAAPHAVDGELFVHLTGEGGNVDYDVHKNEGRGWYTEPSSPHRFSTGYKQGQRNTPDVVEVATVSTTRAEHYLGNEAFQLQIDAYNEPKSKHAAHKVTIDCVSPGDAYAPSVVKPRDFYNGFAMKIDSAFYSLPNEGDVLFEQWWQGSPHHPPLALVITNEADAKARGWADASPDGNFSLILIDDDHGPNSSFPGKPQQFDLGPVTKGQWLRWVVHVRPSPIEANGAVDISINGQEKLKLEHIKVGFNPLNPEYGKQKPLNSMAVNLCIYRINGNNRQRFLFDEIKFADTAKDAEVPG